MSSFVAGTKYRGEFEERMSKVLKEVEEDTDIILFIDEVHTLVGAGGAEGAIDASNIFKPALARGNIRLIGATTIHEYKKYIEKDAALERRFQKVMIETPNKEEVLHILRNLKPIYENYHHVSISDEMIEFIRKNPFVHIIHFLFDKDEYIYSSEDGLVYDEQGYLFEDWNSVTNMWSGHNGIRMRSGKQWEYGWSIKE